VTDEPWNRIEPLITPEPPKPKGGRPRVPARGCLLGILFVLKIDIAWGDLPAELGCSSGATCWRRQRVWQAAGVWSALQRTSRATEWLTHSRSIGGRLRTGRAAACWRDLGRRATDPAAPRPDTLGTRAPT
jgi:transposase